MREVLAAGDRDRVALPLLLCMRSGFALADEGAAADAIHEQKARDQEAAR